MDTIAEEVFANYPSDEEDKDEVVPLFQDLAEQAKTQDYPMAEIEAPQVDAPEEEEEEEEQPGSGTDDSEDELGVNAEIEEIPQQLHWASLRKLNFPPAKYEAMVKYIQSNGTDLSREGKSKSVVSKFKSFMKKYPWRMRGEDTLYIRDAYSPEGYRQEGRYWDYIVIRKDKVPEIIRGVYSNPGIGSFRGRDSLYEVLSRRYLGISRKEVSTFLKNAETHQMTSAVPTRLEGRVMHPIRPQYVNQHWQMDHIIVNEASLVLRNDRTRYLFVVVDLYSKFMWVHPHKRRDAVTVSNSLIDLFLAYGSPQIVQSDNDKAFKSELVADTCRNFNVKQRFSRPYAPNVNGCVERLNGTLKRALYKYMLEFRTKRYIEALGPIVFGYNNIKHRTTGFTPFQVYFGRAPQRTEMDLDEFFEVEEDVTEEQVRTYMEDQEEQRAEQHALVKDRIDKAAEIMLKRAGSKLPLLVVGDTVRKSTLLLSQVRKRTLLHQTVHQKWSKELYKVVERRVLQPNNVEQYRLELYDGLPLATSHGMCRWGTNAVSVWEIRGEPGINVHV